MLDEGGNLYQLKYCDNDNKDKDTGTKNLLQKFPYLILK